MLSQKKADLLAKALKECQTLNAQLSKKCATQTRIIQELEAKLSQPHQSNDQVLLQQVCHILGANQANLLECL